MITSLWFPLHKVDRFTESVFQIDTSLPSVSSLSSLDSSDTQQRNEPMLGLLKRLISDSFGCITGAVEGAAGTAAGRGGESGPISLHTDDNMWSKLHGNDTAANLINERFNAETNWFVSTIRRISYTFMWLIICWMMILNVSWQRSKCVLVMRELTHQHWSIILNNKSLCECKQHRTICV